MIELHTICVGHIGGRDVPQDNGNSLNWGMEGQSSGTAPAVQPGDYLGQPIRSTVIKRALRIHPGLVTGRIHIQGSSIQLQYYLFGKDLVDCFYQCTLQTIEGWVGRELNLLSQGLPLWCWRFR